VIELPSEAELRKLTLRSVTAYAYRLTSRASVPLGGLIEEQLIEAPLNRARKLATESPLVLSDASAVCDDASALVKGMAVLAQDKKDIVFCITRLCDIVHAVIVSEYSSATADERRLEHARVLRKAFINSQFLGTAPDEDVAKRAVEAARHDYEVLRTHFGEHYFLTLGGQLEIPEEWWKLECKMGRDRSASTP
jgi:hypothetical protein